MYALPKGNTNKLFVKTRRGLSQKLDNFDTRDNCLKKDINALPVSNLSSIKPVFHVNGKKTYQTKHSKETLTPQHEEMVKYVHETWKNVVKDLESCSNSLSNTSSAHTNINQVSSNVETAPVQASSTLVNKNNLTTITAIQNQVNNNISNMKKKQISYYSNANTKLPSFEPFDLETFWGQRLFQNLTQC